MTERTTEFTSCPDCSCWSIRVDNGKIVRHERGLGYVPYGLYHRLAKKTSDSVKELAKRNLCTASGKTPNGYTTPQKSED